MSVAETGVGSCIAACLRRSSTAPLWFIDGAEQDVASQDLTPEMGEALAAKEANLLETTA